MKRVLWISRHEMTEEQYNDLCRICGGKVEIDKYGETLKSVDDITDRIESADIVCCVLPAENMAELVQAAGDKKVLSAKAIRTVNPDNSVSFRHGGWKWYKKIIIETEWM